MSIGISLTGICPGCDDYNQRYECVDCGLDLESDCVCILDPQGDELTIYCHGCGSVFEKDRADLVDWEDSPEDDLLGGDLYAWDESATLGDLAGSGKDGRYVTYMKCRHYGFPVEYPDGTTVYASSMYDRNEGEEAPDWGLYLDSGWRAESLAYFPYWPDFGIPPNKEIAAHAIIDSFNKAREHGMWVEVGCIGGHGRTGTALACMGVLAGMTHDEAIPFVRNTYCKEAIETREQEWFVGWFQAFVHGGTAPAYPLWDKDEKKYVDGPKVSFDSELHWKDYDPTDFPKGAPSNVDEEKFTCWEEYEYEVDEEEYEYDEDDLSTELIAMQGEGKPEPDLLADEIF